VSEIHQFLTGYFFWISFAVFLAGLIVQSAAFFQAEREQNHLFFKRFDTLILIRPVIKWFLKPSSGNGFINLILVLFRLSLFIVPVFLLSHNIMWMEFFNWKLPSFENIIFDTMTIIVVVCSIVLFFYNFAKGDKKRALLLILVFGSFLTGLLAHHQIAGEYEFMLLAHILTSELLLIFSPFAMTRVSLKISAGG